MNFKFDIDSDYPIALEQYEKLCNNFFALAKDEETMQKMHRNIM